MKTRNALALTCLLHMLRASCLVVALSAAGAQAQTAPPKDGPLGMSFVPLPKGTFYMGFNGRQGSAKKTEIKEDFEIAVHTVTQGQWQALMGNNPSGFSREGVNLSERNQVKNVSDEDLKLFPVETVSWNDVQEFIKKLNATERASGYVYRLPTSAEWEYACRGGAASEAECSYHFYFAKPTNDLSSTQANFNGRFPDGMGEIGPNLGRPTMVGSYAPNKLGLYDMHGNVFQLCADVASEINWERVYRGSSYISRGDDCRAWRANGVFPTQAMYFTGFRLARVPVTGKEGPLGMQFVSLPKGTFYMGWNGAPGSAAKTEIKEGFQMAVHTVTQGQWQALMGYNNSYFSRKFYFSPQAVAQGLAKDIFDDELRIFPVENASWNEVQKFIEKLNEQERGRGWSYRLPADTEWEYACRGGAASEAECSYHFYFDKPTNDLSSTQANFRGDRPAGQGEKGPNLMRTTKVGSYAPSKLGLYDMHGNVWQWCSDGVPGGSALVLRGGCYDDDGGDCRAGFRIEEPDPTVRKIGCGFRLARVVVQ